MNYSNMLLEELIKEAYREDNQLALAMINILESEMEEEEPGKTYDDGYHDGYEEAVRDAINRLEMM